MIQIPTDAVAKALQISGLTSQEMLERLYELAQGKRMAVEIGAWKGRSSVAIASALADNGRLYCIDPWWDDLYSPESFDVGDHYGEWLDNMTAYHLFRRNIQQMGVDDKVIPLIAASHDTDKYFQDNTLDMLWLDGDHAEQMVLKDLLKWQPKCMADAVICGDDYDMAGVQKAVDAVAKLKGYKVSVSCEGKLWEYRR